MKNLITFITEAFQMSWEDIALKTEDKTIKYKELLNAIKEMAVFINTLYITGFYKECLEGKKLKIALVASSNINWVITFLGILFSGNIPVLISTRLSKNKIYHILNDNNIAIVFTNVRSIYTEGIYHCININNLDSYKRTQERNNVINLFRKDTSICYTDNKQTDLIVYSPNELKKCVFSNTEILSLLSTLGSKNIFSQGDEICITKDFSYNYIFCLLLPLLSGSSIFINKEVDYTNNQIVILSKSEIEDLLWLEDITIVKFVWYKRLFLLGKWLMKRKINKIFPNIKTLIILNSSPSPWIENLFKWSEVPYTITYGTTETMGIATYTEPSKFKKGSVGDVLPYKNIITFSNKLFLVNSELNYLGDTGYKKGETLYFTGKEGDIFYNSKNLVILSNRIIDLFRNITLIEACYIVMIKDRLFLIVNLNESYCEKEKIYSLKEARQLLRMYIQEINKILLPHEKIYDVVIEPVKFKKDLNNNIIKKCLQ
jgi:acyl-CoA synthetase (AMP-forming)/AMP-acid ligase II